MTLPAYPKYKPSGVEWLGEIPQEWEVRRLKFDISKAGSGVTPKGGANVYQSSGIPILRSQNIHFDGLRLDDVAYIADDVHEGMSNSKVLAGDVLLNITGASIGRCYFFDGSIGEANVNQHVCIIRPEAGLLTQYLHYVMCSDVGQLQIQLEQSGSGREGLNFADLKNFIIPMMEKHEQKAITDYLDKKAGQIDELIGKKKELIKKLKEQRTAIITHAVTKGLDDSAPMKDSGVEWLGQVPEHWEDTPLRRIIISLDQGWSPLAGNNPAEAEEWGVLKLSAISRAGFIPEENKAFDGSLKTVIPLTPSSGDILLSRANTPALVGACCVVETDCPRRIIPDLIYRLRFDDRANCIKFLGWVLISTYARAQIESDARGSSGSMVKISRGHVLSWRVMLPFKIEQQAIADYLDQKTGQLDGLIEKATAVIQRLEEYRTAVITAAVTGKVTVDACFQPRCG